MHYELIDPTVHTGISDKVVVSEFFSYGCGHCFNFEPLLESFETRLPEGVVVQRIPVIWNNNAGMKLLAKTYYAAQILDVLDPVHGAMFNAIHRQRKRIATPEAVRAVFVDSGVDGKKFDRAFKSFGTDSMVDKLLLVRGCAHQRHTIANGQRQVPNRHAPSRWPSQHAKDRCIPCR